MTTEMFWKIIETARRLAPDDLEAQKETLTGLLHALTPDEIIQFDQYFSQYLAQAYTWELWGAAYIIGDGCSDDGFMDFRSWLIAKGKKVYENALRDPETLLRVIKAFDGNGQFEGFQYVAMEVWKQKASNGLQNFPTREHTLEIVGESWKDKEDDLPRRFPKLWRKFAMLR